MASGLPVFILLQSRTPGSPTADLAAAMKLIERPAKPRLSTRDQDRASTLSVRLSAQAETQPGKGSGASAEQGGDGGAPRSVPSERAGCAPLVV